MIILRFYHFIKWAMLKNMSRLHEKIRDILEKRPDLTQKGLAERMGLNPAAVNRMLYGQRKIMAEEIPVIESYLGAPLPLSAANAEYRQGEKTRGGFSESAKASSLSFDAAPAPPIPVYKEMSFKEG